MREIQGISDEPQARRRWFHDDYFDLFVWQTASGEITRFQLCYGKSSSERALVWDKFGGLFHDGVGGGASGAGEIIGAGTGPGKPAADPVLSRLNATAGSLPDDIHEVVAGCVREYVERKPVIPARRKHFRRASWQHTPAEHA